jgi:hypothetical protein
MSTGKENRLCRVLYQMRIPSLPKSVVEKSKLRDLTSMAVGAHGILCTKYLPDYLTPIISLETKKPWRLLKD